jgi:Cytochrome c oxidase assembly protein CtaG/Cox11
MVAYAKNSFLAAVAILALLLPLEFLLTVERRAPANEHQVLVKYLKALYARDFRQAYRFISSQDRRLKSEDVYVKEQGAFTGFTAEVARKLSGWIKARPLEQRPDGDRMHIKLDLSLPDANAVAPLVLDWDEEQLNKLPRGKQQRLLAVLEKLKRDGDLKTIEGSEDFVLVKEGTTWKVFLDWAAGVRVIFDAVVPQGYGVEAQPTIRETVVHPGDLFTVDFRVKNQTSKDLLARVDHHVEPESLADYLDLVECALLFPVRIPPHQEQSYTSRYLLRGDLPEGVKELKVTYDFKLER